MSKEFCECLYCKQKHNKEIISERIYNYSTYINIGRDGFHASTASHHPYFDYSGNKGFLNYLMFICPNPDCEKVNVLVKFIDKDKKISKVWMLPDNIAKNYNDEIIPRNILDIYEEACSVFNVSYKAACVFIRKCLEAILKDYWKEDKDVFKGDCNKLTKALEESKKCDKTVIKAFNTIRKCGNMAIHFNKNSNYLIEDIKEEEVKSLIWFVEFLFKEWDINDYDTEKNFEKLQKLDSKS